MKIMDEFKTFIMRGNVIDMAVGVIIGAAFGKIVNSMVNDVLMPPIGLLLGKVDFSNLYFNLSDKVYATLSEAQTAGAPVISYGIFLNNVVNFLIIAFVIFMLIQQINRLQRKPKEAPVAAATTKSCPYCFSTISLQATRCPNCTSDLKA